MDTRTTRPLRSAVSLGLGVALVATAGVVAATPVVTALANQGTTARPAAARPAPATLNATVVRTALGSDVTAQGRVHGVSCADTVAPAAPGLPPGCRITAMRGTVDVKDGSTSHTKQLTVWKFADTTGTSDPDVDTVSAGAASVVLEGQVGVPMTITIHNALSLPVGLSIPQLDSEDPDTHQLQLHDVSEAPDGSAEVGAAASGGDRTYSFTPNRAGTYTYQAALTDNGSRGVAMGLVGALVVRPGATTSEKVGAEGTDAVAYDQQEGSFQDEAVLVYTDVDTAMAANPVGFNMRKYRADYHLINGQAYPDVPSISTAPSHVVMLRVVNGSILEKSPTILGTRFEEFATGSRPLPARLAVSGRLVQTGDTFDATVTMPPVDKVRYAVYDAPGALRNGDEINLAPTSAVNAPALGGGLVLIDSGFEPGRLTGAAVTGLAADVQPGSGSSPLTVSALLKSRDGADVTEAEVYVDSLATAIPVTFASPCGPQCSASVVLPGSLLGALSSGMHPVWFRAKTGASAWGPYALIRVRVDNVGPDVTQLTPSATHTNLGTDLDVTATLDERTTGGSLVASGRYWISSSMTDTEPGSAAVQGDLTLNGARVTASADATISLLAPDPLDPTPDTPSLPLVPSAFSQLTEGTYQLYVQGVDDRGNPGKPVSVPLVVDTTAPATDSITLDPTSTNGLQGSASKPGYVRITASVRDDLSAVTAVDGYVGAVKPAGNANGIYFSHGTGTTWTADLPLSWLAGLKADGKVTVNVVGTDAAGNRGDGSTPATPVTITIDRAKPVTDVVAFSQPTNFVGSPSSRTLFFTLTATDATPAGSTGIVSAQYWVGTGNPIDVTSLFVSASDGPVSVTRSFDLRNARFYGATSVPVTFRVRDAAGNVSQVTRRYLTHPILFGNGYEAAAPPATAPSVSATGWNLGSTGAVAIADTAGNRLAGLQSLRVATANVAAAARPAAYYAVDLAVPELAGSSMTTMHGGFVFSPRAVATRCLTGTNAGTCAPKPVTIFAASSSASLGSAHVVQLQYGRASTTSPVRFRVGVRQTSGIVYGTWTTVPATPTYTVTVDWSATGANSRPAVRVNATNVARPGGTASATNLVRSVGVGVLTTVASANPGQTGYFLFDSVTVS